MYKDVVKRFIEFPDVFIGISYKNIVCDRGKGVKTETLKPERERK